MPLSVDSGLIEAARSDRAGLERLVAAVWPEAYRIAFSILRDRGLAEDAAQEACATMAASLSTLKNAAAFRGWSYKIIANHAISVFRRRPRTQNLDVLADREMHFDQSDALDLYKALAALPVEQRTAVILHYYAGLTSGEIAASIGLPSSTIRFYLMLARRALRKSLTAASVSVARPSKEVFSNVH